MRVHQLAVVALALAVSGCLQFAAPPPSVGPEDRSVGTGAESLSEFLALWSLPPGDPTPVALGSCTALTATLNARLLDETLTRIDESLARGGEHGYRYFSTTFAAESAAADGATTSRSAADADVTGTNNQEAGVDEADVLKTDGAWTYVIRGSTLHILHSDQVGDLAPHHQVDLGETVTAGKLLLVERDPADAGDDRLVVITTGWKNDPDAADGSEEADVAAEAFWSGGEQVTRVTVYDLADRTAPDVVAEHWLEGRDVAARLVDGVAHVVVQTNQDDRRLTTHVYPTEQQLDERGLTWREYHDLDEDERRPILEERAAELRANATATIQNLTLRDHVPAHAFRDAAGDPVPVAWTDDACHRFVTSEHATGRAVTTIFSVDATADATAWNTTRLLGTAPIVYGATNALVFAAPTMDWWWFWGHEDMDEATDLHWFDLDGLTVTHRVSGRVAGIVRDSFSLDVHDDVLRVATTTGQWGRWWSDDPAPMVSHVLTLTEQGSGLVPVGVVPDIAPGEQIWSARFTDERAYIVTFEQVDPLWVIDLTDPVAPTILGELEIPGVSTYIHPLDEDTLLTIGYGPGENGLGLDRGSLQVSLFDITDPTRPTRSAVLDVSPDNGWSWSDATREHKAFTYWDAIGKLAVPMTTYDPEDRDAQVSLRLIDVDPEAQTLTVYGDADQDALLVDDGDGKRDYRSWQPRIERSYFLGFPETGDVSVYAFSGLGMTAHDLGTLDVTAAVAFPRS